MTVNTGTSNAYAGRTSLNSFNYNSNRGSLSNYQYRRPEVRKPEPRGFPVEEEEDIKKPGPMYEDIKCKPQKGTCRPQCPEANWN